MSLPATWNPPGYTAPWAAPTMTGLATLQLVGDLHFPPAGVAYPDKTKSSVYDALGRDIRDRLVHDPPDHILQMGDLASGIDIGHDTVLAMFDLFRTWLTDHDQDPDHWDVVMGNHDIPGRAGEPLTVTPAQWAAYWGYPGPSFTIDLGEVRVLVVGPTGLQGDPPAEGSFPVRPLTRSDVAWIDQQLLYDRRPTLLAVHAPLNGSAGIAYTDWKNCQSTVARGVAATDLLEVLNAHGHCIGWVHGHTHSLWNDATRSNTSLLDIGSRKIAVVDASAIFEKAEDFGGTVRQPTSFYVTVLDDGLTLEVRWRSHHLTMWDAVDGVRRKRRLTAT